VPKLTFKGDHYIGDGITAQRGDTVEVSEAKAKQLLADFADDWAPLAPAKAVRKSPRNKAQKPAKDK